MSILSNQIISLACLRWPFAGAEFRFRALFAKQV